MISLSIHRSSSRNVRLRMYTEVLFRSVLDLVLRNHVRTHNPLAIGRFLSTLRLFWDLLDFQTAT